MSDGGLSPASFDRLGLLQHRCERPAAIVAGPAKQGAGSDQELFMAVQQNKKSPSKRGMHRSHNALVTPGTGIEPTTGEVHLRHHISPTGFYRGRKVLKTKQDA
jgi:large subunit ribosomal protein L32